MKFRERIFKMLGGDKLTVDPETPIALIEVRDFIAPMVVDALQEAGIVATAVDERSALWTGERLQSRSTIFVPASYEARPPPCTPARPSIWISPHLHRLIATAPSIHARRVTCSFGVSRALLRVRRTRHTRLPSEGVARQP